MGAARFCLKTSMAERLLLRAVEAGVRFEEVERTGDKELMAWVNGADERAFRAFLERFSVAYEITQRRGAWRALHFFRARLSLFVSLLCALSLLWLCAGRVWWIRISGETEPRQRRAVEETLREYGVRPGVLKNDVDAVALSKKLLAEMPGYAFIGVKVSGVFLRVEAVREEEAPEVYVRSKWRDLAADADGVVLSVNVLAGQARVKPGDTVRAGYLLIAGEEKKSVNGETARVRAEGSVIARTWTQGECSQPLTRGETRFTGRVAYASRLESPIFTRALAGENPFENAVAEEEPLAIVGLFFPARIIRTAFRECEIARVPVPGMEARACAHMRALALARGQARADARESATWVEYRENGEAVTARVVVEWTREITSEARGG